jgi:uncharacterized membrane protein YdbT with pleckstrin-like domain
MPWPEETLTADESIISSFRPHWKLLFVPIGWFLLLSIGYALILIWVPTGSFGWVAFIIYLGLAFWFFVQPVLTWWTSMYVLTSERLMTRSGLISKTGIEIPLENITNVNFSQSMIERMIGAGDLLVESAGTSGQSEFKDIPHPDVFQAELYRTREARTLYLSGRHDPSQQATEPQRGGAANAEAIQKLAELRDQGHISDEEYAVKRQQLLDEM